MARDNPVGVETTGSGKSLPTLCARLPGSHGPDGHFLVDFSRLIGLCSLMVQSAHRDTHHTVAAGIMEALGKGFLIATAGVLAGLLIGTAPLASIGLWTVGVAATTGVACMVGSALVRNAGCDRCEDNGGGLPQAANVRDGMGATPGTEAAADVAPEERWARRMAMNGRRREHATGRGG